MTYPPNGQFPSQYPTNPPEPPRSQWTSPAVLTAVIAGVVVLAVGVVGAYVFAGNRSDGADPAPTDSAPHSGPPSAPDTVVTVTAPPPNVPTIESAPPSTTRPPRATPTVRDADWQGFIGYTEARCNADDEAVFIGETYRSKVVICQVGSDSDRLYYKGYANGNGIEIGFPSRIGTTFEATNNGTVYQVSPSALKIFSSGNSPHVEPMLDYWVN